MHVKVNDTHLEELKKNVEIGELEVIDMPKLVGIPDSTS